MSEPTNKPTHRKHSHWHDYSSRCIYHVTIVVSDREPVLGHLEGMTATGSICRCGSLGNPDYAQDAVVKARMQLTPLGIEVSKCIANIPVFGARKGWDLQILQQRIMDTHIHFVLYVRQPMVGGKLGDIIRGFKTGCNQALRRAMADGTLCRDGRWGMSGTVCPGVENGNVTGTVCPGFGTEKVEGDRGMSGYSLGSPSSSRGAMRPWSPRLLANALFEEDYDETILTHQGQLKHMINYVAENPWRKWLKINKPEWLCVTRNIEIAGRLYDAIGNVNLLALPRFQVHVRYKWLVPQTEAGTSACRNHKNECVKKARNNYALVSPFINPHEAEVRDYCLKEGHSVIALVDNGFTDYAQCPAALLDYCNNGQVLVLVPSAFPHIDKKPAITKNECRVLNEYAEEICGE